MGAADVAVRTVIQHPVDRQIDEVVPCGLLRRRVAAVVADGVCDAERAPQSGPLGRRQGRDHQVRRVVGGHRDRLRGHVVALALVFLHGPGRVAGNAHQPGRDGGRREAAGPIAVIGHRQQGERTADLERHREGDGGDIRLAGPQHAVSLVADGGVAALARRGQLEVAVVERAVQRQEDGVGPGGLTRSPVADVRHGEADGDRRPGCDRRGHDEVRHPQIGLRVNHRQGCDAAVMGRVLIGTLGEEAQRAVIVAARLVGRVCCAAAGICEDVDVIGPADAVRQDRVEILGVAGARRKPGVDVGDGAERHGARQDEGRVARQVDGVDPVLRAAPDRPGPGIGDRVADGGGVAAVGRGGHVDGRDLKVRPAARDAGGRRADIVAAFRVGRELRDDDDVGAPRRRVQRDGLGVGVAGAGREVADAGEAAQVPDLCPRCGQRRAVGQIDVVYPGRKRVGSRNAGPVVLDRPGKGELARRHRGGVRRDGGDCHIRQQHRCGRHTDHLDGGGLVVVALVLVRVVRVDVGRQLGLQQHAVGIDPGGQVVLPGHHMRRQADADDAVVAGALHQHAAGVLDLGQQNVALARVRPLPVDRQPDLLGERSAVGGAGALVRDGVAHRRLVALEGQRRRGDVADHQVREGDRVHIDRHRAGAVRAIRVFIHRLVRVGLDDDVAGAAIALRDHEGRRIGLILALRTQRRTVLQRADQDVVQRQRAVERQIDLVRPLRGTRRDRAHVRHHERHRRAAAGIHGRRCGHAADDQVRARQHRHQHGGRRDRAVVALERALIDGVGGVRNHRQEEAARHMQRQHDLLGARVCLSGQQRPARRERADHRARSGNARLLQQHAVRPAATGLGAARVGDGPANRDRRALRGRAGHDDGADHQVGRGRQRDRHRGRRADAVIGVDELERCPATARSDAGGAVVVGPVGARRHHDEVVRPLDPLRQRHGRGPGVAVADRQEAEMVETAQRLAVRPVRGLADVQRVHPFRHVRGAEALVAHGPGHRLRLPTGGTGGGCHAAHLVAGVGIRHDVEGMAGRGRIVGHQTVFEHGAVRVCADEQGVVPVEAGRQ